MIDVYELADVGRILGLEKSKAANWTLGRPFKVVPSIRASSGKGSRNLYSEEDLFTLMLVKQLHSMSLPPAIIQQVIDSEQLRQAYFWENYRFLVVSVVRGKVSLKAIAQDRYQERLLMPEEHTAEFSLCLVDIVRTVRQRVESLRQQRSKRKARRR